MIEFDAPLGNTEAVEEKDYSTVEPLDVTATDTAETEAQAQKLGGYQVGWETAQLSYGGDIENETYQKIHSSYNDYSENAQYYDAWKNIENWTLENGKRARHQLALDSGRFSLDENNELLNNGEQTGAFEEWLYDTDALKGALFAQRHGYSEDTFNSEYETITKKEVNRLAKAGKYASGVEMALGGLAGHIAQPETAIDLMSPGKIMASTLKRGAAKAFATEFGFAMVGETMREQRIAEHMEKANLEYTLWDSVENILINSGLAGSIRGIGSAVTDKITFNKINDSIVDATDKEIFARYAQRENYKLTKDTNKHIEIVNKAREDLDNGLDVDVAEHLDIDIETKTDDAIEAVNVNEELHAREAEVGLPEQTQKFIDEFEDSPAPQEATNTNPYEGMATPKEAEALIEEISIDNPEIMAEHQAIKKAKKALTDRQEAMKAAKEPKIGGSEDEAKAEVQSFFRKDISPDARYKNLNKEDIAELERMENAEILLTKPANITDEDWIEANQVFAKFGDNLTAGTIAGIEEDENGNITLNPEKFVLGLGGYTALKALAKSPTIQKEFKEYLGRIIDELEGNPKFDYLTGTQRAVEAKKPLHVDEEVNKFLQDVKIQEAKHGKINELDYSMMDISDRDLTRVQRAKQTADEINADEEEAIYTVPNFKEFEEVYPDQFKYAKIKPETKGNKVKIYRSAVGDIEAGDWIGLEKKYAESHSRTEEHKLYEKWVDMKDIRWQGADANEWIYLPQKIVEELK